LNLGGMIVPVGGVNFQPIFSSVRSAFRVRACATPVVIAHKLKQLRSRLARVAKSFQRGGHLALVILQARGVIILLIPLNHWTIFGDQAAQPYSADGFAVGEMMHNLGGTPFSLDWVRS